MSKGFVIKFEGTPEQNVANFEKMVDDLKSKAQPVNPKLEDLWDLCQKFIDKNGVTGENDVMDLPSYLMDELLLDICQIVGYATSDRPYEEAPSQSSVVEPVASVPVVLTEEQDTGSTADGRELA